MESLPLTFILVILSIFITLVCAYKTAGYKDNIRRHTTKPIALFPVLAKVVVQEGNSTKVVYEIAKVNKDNQWVAVTDGRLLKGVHSWVYIKDIFKSD
jgi:hypothetical protein